VLAGLALLPAVAGATPAFVRKGAFLLSPEPSVQRNGRWVHDLVGYAPVGTVVYVEEGSPSRELFNYGQDRYESYVAVRSDLGVPGLLRSDLKTDLGETQVLVPVGDRRIPIRTQGSTRYESRRLAEFSRSDGAYLVLVGDADSEFYDVELPWTAAEGRPADRGRLRRRWVDEGEVLLLSRDAVAPAPPASSESPWSGTIRS
jgi:hypothetical protein